MRAFRALLMGTVLLSVVALPVVPARADVVATFDVPYPAHAGDSLVATWTFAGGRPAYESFVVTNASGEVWSTSTTPLYGLRSPVSGGDVWVIDSSVPPGDYTGCAWYYPVYYRNPYAGACGGVTVASGELVVP